MAGLLRRVMDDGTYNGWKNYGTWNVALWVGNNEYWYREAVAYATDRRKRGKPITWLGFCQWASLDRSARTPDGIRWQSRELDHKGLAEMLEEFVD